MRRCLRITYLFVPIAAVLLILLSEFTALGADAPSEKVLLSNAQLEADKDRLMGVLAQESKAIVHARTSAIREGETLILRMKSGVMKSYADHPSCKNAGQEEQCKIYRLIVYAASRRVFILAHAGHEDVRYLLVDDEAGEETVLQAFPHFSPSGRHILALNVDDEQLGSAMQLWSRSGRKFELKWKAAPFAHATSTSLTTYRLLEWKEDKKLTIEAATHDFPSVPEAIKHFLVRQKGDAWHVINK